MLRFYFTAERMMKMPLTMINTGAKGTIKKVGGSAETRRFLENLGFVTGFPESDLCAGISV